MDRRTRASPARAAFALGLTALLAASPLATRAASSPTVTVTGEGTITKQPDRAVLSLAAITNDDSAQTATAQNNAMYEEVLRRMASLGIAQSAIATSAYDVAFVPKPEAAAPYKPPRTGYVVTRRLSVSIDNLSLVGRAIDAAVGAGVPEIDGVTFGLRDPRSAYAQALGAAMRDAATQAEALATAAHLRLGNVRTISSARELTPPAPVMRMAVEAAVPTKIPPSQVNVIATVNVTYDLQP